MVECLDSLEHLEGRLKMLTGADRICQDYGQSIGDVSVNRCTLSSGDLAVLASGKRIRNLLRGYFLFES